MGQTKAQAVGEQDINLLTIVELEPSLNSDRPKLLHQKRLDLLSDQQATSLDFSACSSFLLLGFSYISKSHPGKGEDQTLYPVAYVYRTKDCRRVLRHRSNCIDNCSNNARF